MPSTSQGQEGSQTLLEVIVQRKWSILAFAIGMAILASFYVSFIPPRYTATASVMLDGRQLRLISNDQLVSGQSLDEVQIRSMLEVFNSKTLAKTVVTQNGLNKLPEFCADTPSFFEQVRDSLFSKILHRASGSGAPVACETSVENAARQLLGMVTATNEGRSYIIRIQIEAGDPEVAANIANAYANAFVADRFERHTELAEKARQWLIGYIDRLGRQTAQADAAVAQYRSEHHLIPLRGETLATQNLGDVNGQLSAVESEITQKQSLLSQMTTVMKSNGNIMAIAPLVNSSLVNAPLLRNLVEKEATLSSRDAELRTQYGKAHPQVIATGALLAQTHRQILAEITKTMDTLGQEITALQARRTLLTSQLSSLQSRVGQQGDEDVQLQELLRAAETSRHIYQSALTRLKEIEVEQGVSRPDSQLATEATPPPFPIYPRKSLMVVGAFLAGLCLGTGAAFGLSLRQLSFRNAKHIEFETGLPMLGVFAVPPAHILPQDVALDAPLSIEAECLQKILVNILRARSEQTGSLAKVVLITSALPGEGKTSFSLALGRAAVRAGLSTMLIDCDLRRPTVLQKLRGYIEPRSSLASGRDRRDPNYLDYQNMIVTDHDSALKIIPLAEKEASSPHVIIGAPAMKQMLQGLRRTYDLVLIDTPPLLAASDALPLSYLVDEVIVLVDWRTTPRDAVSEAIEMLRRHDAPVGGIVLGKVDLEKYTKAAGAGSYARSYYHYGPSKQVVRSERVD
ncbi:GumC family protein [Beijerinckia indica]|uniref:GumC family protein n=1 Tax=Beijerinckia indica TaxID=533 RepID=UPI0013054555|nr:polysaccharide biosynthesis tyrosine autokinase [Beijerinckia indica]